MLGVKALGGRGRGETRAGRGRGTAPRPPAREYHRRARMPAAPSPSAPAPPASTTAAVLRPDLCYRRNGEVNELTALARPPALAYL